MTAHCNYLDTRLAQHNNAEVIRGRLPERVRHGDHR
jgi:hypothetical protein